MAGTDEVGSVGGSPGPCLLRQVLGSQEGLREGRKTRATPGMWHVPPLPLPAHPHSRVNLHPLLPLPPSQKCVQGPARKGRLLASCLRVLEA